MSGRQSYKKSLFPFFGASAHRLQKKSELGKKKSELEIFSPIQYDHNSAARASTDLKIGASLSYGVTERHKKIKFESQINDDEKVELQKVTFAWYWSFSSQQEKKVFPQSNIQYDPTRHFQRPPSHMAKTKTMLLLKNIVTEHNRRFLRRNTQLLQSTWPKRIDE